MKPSRHYPLRIALAVAVALLFPICCQSFRCLSQQQQPRSFWRRSFNNCMHFPNEDKKVSIRSCSRRLNSRLNLFEREGIEASMGTTTVVLVHAGEHAAEHGKHAEEVLLSLPGPIEGLLHEPLFWSTICMLSVVALLLAWEEFVKKLRESLPTELLAVVDSMLAEMGGLGFVGLFLSVVVTGRVVGELIEELSETFLGDGEILLETFEFLHTAFFEVGIGFFAVAGITVGAVLSEIQQIERISELALDTDGDGEVSVNEIANALDVPAMIVDTDMDGELSAEEITAALRATEKVSLISQLTMSSEELGAEALLIREALIRRLQLPESFQIERYFEQIFAHNLEEIVELSPITWLPLIPLIAIDNSVDLSNDVVSASSSNAFVSCGEFLASPLVLYSSSAIEAVCLVWGLFNFWKVFSIKNMLVPTLVREQDEKGEAIMLPPRYLDEKLKSEFNSSPAWVAPIESFFTSSQAKSINHPAEELFGEAGSEGPSLYRNSIKFHTWLCVAQIVFYGTQIVLRDVEAIFYHSSDIGNPDMIVPETIIYGFFVAICVALLALTPKTFLYYSYATSIEGMTKDWAIKLAVEKVEVGELLAQDEFKCTEDIISDYKIRKSAGRETNSDSSNGETPNNTIESSDSGEINVSNSGK